MPTLIDFRRSPITADSRETATGKTALQQPVLRLHEKASPGNVKAAIGFLLALLLMAAASAAAQTSPQPSVQTRAQAPTAAALAHLVDQHYNHLQSLRTRYTERYRGMGIDRTETGTLTLRKPGRMRWAYDTPAGKVFLLDGKTAISYTPGDSEAQSLAASNLDDLHSPLKLLLGHTNLTRELEGLTVAPVQMAAASMAPAQRGYTLSGAPRGMASRLRTVLLTVDLEGRILDLRLIEPDDAETTFTFSDMRENVPTDDAEFHFKPPPGVTIVTGASPLS